MPNWDGKVRWHTPCPWPNEHVTITCRRYGSGHCESDKRTCYGSEHVYLLGVSPPNYPVPALDTCAWCGKQCLTCPVHELRCLRHRADGKRGLECPMARL
jgi:hypothetical protein